MILKKQEVKYQETILSCGGQGFPYKKDEGACRKFSKEPLRGAKISFLSMFPGFDSQTWRHMWVERFFSGYSGFPGSPQKPTFGNSNSILECTDISERVLANYLVLLGG